MAMIEIKDLNLVTVQNSQGEVLDSSFITKIRGGYSISYFLQGYGADLRPSPSPDPRSTTAVDEGYSIALLEHVKKRGCKASALYPLQILKS
jgi:hypothetical protein